jgi:hypothetical protein
MSAIFKKLMNGADGGLPQYQELAENSFDAEQVAGASGR